MISNERENMRKNELIDAVLDEVVDDRVREIQALSRVINTKLDNINKLEREVIELNGYVNALILEVTGDYGIKKLGDLL